MINYPQHLTVHNHNMIIDKLVPAIQLPELGNAFIFLSTVCISCKTLDLILLILYFHVLYRFPTFALFLLLTCSLSIFYSRSTSRVTSISKNEMNIQNPLCNVRHLNGMLNISVEIFPKKRY